VMSGTYRETINLSRSGTGAQHPISIQASPGANVNIKGSDLVDGWVLHSASIWKHTNWSVNSQQVFVDGVPLQQIGENSPFHSQNCDRKPILPPVGKGIADMYPGSFWYDKTARTLYIWLQDGSAPNNHQLEASVRDFIIPPNEVNFIELNGLKFSHSNLTAKGLSLGIVSVWGKSWVISSCTFNHGDYSGVSIVGEGHKITGSTFNYNGNTGIYINGSDSVHGWSLYPNRPLQNILIEGNETNYNNYRTFYMDWEAGGIKVGPSDNTITISQHKSISNKGHGIWFDGFCGNITIDRCTVADNLGAGIFYEISDDALISNNLVLRNAKQGIYVSASDHVKVYNNTIYKNWAGIVLHGMPRSEHPSLSNNEVKNNIIVQNSIADFVLYSDPTSAINNTSDHNLYYRSDGTVKISFTKNTGYDVNFTNLQSFFSATTLEQHSLLANPLWVDESSGNFSLKATSPAIDSGTSVEGLGDKDILGNPRVTTKKAGTPIIDMGAVGFQPAQTAPPQRLRIP